jgi:ketosteroid isomerase-like protein
VSAAARDLLTAFVAAFDRHDPDGIAALYAPGATIRCPDAADDVDAVAVGAAYARWFTVTPDARIQVRSAVADDQLGVAEVVITGTNTGPLQLTDVDRAVLGTDMEALPPTGRAVAVPAVFAINIADGRIAAERQYFSPLALPLQLGLLER